MFRAPPSRPMESAPIGGLSPRDPSPQRRLRTIAALSILLTALGHPAARAQVATTEVNLQPTQGWTFAVTPYAWLPTISTTFDYSRPRGGTVTSSVSAGFGDYISELNFGLMLGAEARHDRFSIMTDLVYSNASITTANSHFSSVNLGPGPIYIPREQQLSTGTRLGTTVWSVAGGYTLLRGEWGNLDALAGIRTLFLGSTTNYRLAADIFLPSRTVALSRTGSLNVGVTEVEGIGGVTGRINIPNSRFYLPFYFDAGGGAVPFTWQAYGAVAYRAASWADLSLGYRYLSFQNGSHNGVQKLSLGGVLLATNLRF